MWWVAASPIVVLVGLGASSQHRFDDGEPGASVEPAVEVLAGYRVHEHVAIGLRASASQFGYRGEIVGNMAYTAETSKLHTFELAIAVPLELGRFVVTPWVGRHYANGRLEVDDYFCMPECHVFGPTVSDVHRSPLTAWGLLAAFDLIVDGSHRVSVFVDLQASTTKTHLSAIGPVTDDGFKAVTFGIAYRH